MMALSSSRSIRDLSSFRYPWNLLLYGAKVRWFSQLTVS